MRDCARIRPLLAELGAYWGRNPDLRLGQIVTNATVEFGYSDPFSIEDEKLLEGIRALAARPGAGASDGDRGTAPCEPYDWRAEALRLRAGVPDGVARLGAETLATAPVPNPNAEDDVRDDDDGCLVCGGVDCNERHAP